MPFPVTTYEDCDSIVKEAKNTVVFRDSREKNKRKRERERVRDEGK